MNNIIAKCQVYLEWDPRDISIAPLTGGLTNVLYTCMNTRNNQTVVCRIYGEADVCRNEEVLLSRILGDKGLSPRLSPRRLGKWSARAIYTGQEPVAS